MKKVILIIGSIATLIMAILWYLNKVTEPMLAIGTGILTLLGYIFVPEGGGKGKTNIKQKHSGIGDNVAGNKVINK